jgi:hypothetical protein
MKAKKQTKKQTPKQRVRAEERRLRALEYFRRNQQLFDRERLMRLLRDTRMEAQQIDDYLRTLNPAYRQAAEPYGTKVAKMRKMFEQANPSAAA